MIVQRESSVKFGDAFFESSRRLNDAVYSAWKPREVAALAGIVVGALVLFPRFWMRFTR